jgi:hypothetical protein
MKKEYLLALGLFFMLQVQGVDEYLAKHELSSKK